MGLYTNGESAEQAYTADPLTVSGTLAFTLYEFDFWDASDMFTVTVGGIQRFSGNLPDPFSGGCSGDVCVSGGTPSNVGLGLMADRTFSFSITLSTPPVGSGTLSVRFDFNSVTAGGTRAIDNLSLNLSC